MRKLWKYGKAFTKQAGWKDWALVKTCLFSLGIICGVQVSKKYKKPILLCASCAFAATYFPIISRFARCVRKVKKKEKGWLHWFAK